MVAGRNAQNYTVAATEGYRYTPAGATNYTIAWYNNGTLIPGANTLNYTTPTVSATTNFSVEITAQVCGQPIILKDTIKKSNNIHIIGLLSDGGVHSHIDHIIALAQICSKVKVIVLVLFW